MARVTRQSLAEELRAHLGGEVVGPADPGYDEARTVLAMLVDRFPAAIARPVDAVDVARVVRAARRAGVDLAVRGGGHSASGHGVCDDGIVLDLSALKALDVDAEACTAWAETGLTAAEYTVAVGEYGLATGFGDYGSVGIGGIALGGGVGYLSRKYGLTLDDVLAAEVVTADGELVHADAETRPDLFWAIRGGGGNFGVVTRLQLRLHDVSEVLAGMMLLPAEPDVLAGFVALAERAPDELTTMVSVVTVPPMPFVPSEHHGSIALMAALCYAGDPDDGAAVLEPFRQLATPLVDTVDAMRYPDLFPPTDASFRPIAVGYSGFAPGISEHDAAAVIDEVRDCDAPMRMVQIRVLGGAVARVAPEATAYAHRAERILVNSIAFCSADPDDVASRTRWTREVTEGLCGTKSAAYVNFVGDDGPERARAVYPGGTWDRLAEVKARYDPDNVFRLNLNVPPAPGRSLPDRVEYRREDDEELLGFLVPDGESFVPVTVFGYPLAEPVERAAAEETLERFGLSYLAEPWDLRLEDETRIRVEIVEAGPDRVVVQNVDPGASLEYGTRFTLAAPVDGQLTLTA